MTKPEITKDELSDPPDLTELSNDSELSGEENDEKLGDKKPTSFCVEGVYAKYHPTKEEKESYKPEFFLPRQRIKTKPMENPSETEEYETAMFEPDIGLIGKGKFWHEYDNTAKVIREDRAVLFQSEEHYERLWEHELFYWCFDDIDFMATPTFGEQVIVSGVETSELAIGDVFEIEGGHSPLVIEITAPRKPCAYINYKHNTDCGIKGIQHYTHQKNMAGWFGRVLVAGELRDGMKFIRTKQPNPKWTLTYIHKALYGEGKRVEMMARLPSWKRDRKELEELIALPQLGEYEWKCEARKLLMKMDGVDVKTVDKRLIDPQKKGNYDYLDVFNIDALLDTVSSIVETCCMGFLSGRS